MSGSDTLLYRDNYFSIYRLTTIITSILVVLGLITDLTLIHQNTFYGDIEGAGIALFYPVLIAEYAHVTGLSRRQKYRFFLIAVTVYLMISTVYISGLRDVSSLSLVVGDIIDLYNITIITFFSIIAYPMYIRKLPNKEWLKTATLLYLATAGILLALLRITLSSVFIDNQFMEKAVYLIATIALGIRLAIVFIEREHERKSKF